MKRKKDTVKTWILALSVALLVVILIGGLVVLDNRERDRNGITLPTVEQGEAPPEAPPEVSFVEITPQNVARAVASLARPTQYHETLKTVYYDGGVEGKTVTTEIWVLGELRRLARKSESGIRNLLTDGKTAYIWYSDESWSVESVTLTEDLTFDALAGVPTYEALTEVTPAQVLHAAYSLSEDGTDTPCIFAETAGTDGMTTRYRVDLESGLLYGAEGTRGGETVYAVSRTALEQPEADAAFLANFRLPGGKQPFPIGETEMTPE